MKRISIILTTFLFLSSVMPLAGSDTPVEKKPRSSFNFAYLVTPLGALATAASAYFLGKNLANAYHVPEKRNLLWTAGSACTLLVGSLGLCPALAKYLNFRKKRKDAKKELDIVPFPDHNEILTPRPKNQENAIFHNLQGQQIKPKELKKSTLKLTTFQTSFLANVTLGTLGGIAGFYLAAKELHPTSL